MTWNNLLYDNSIVTKNKQLPLLRVRDVAIVEASTVRCMKTCILTIWVVVLQRK